MEEFARRSGLISSLGDGNSPKFIHVAGTNGKGSTTAFVQSCLEAQGFRTGAFFSPFVIDPRERVQYGREYIGKDELAEVATFLKPIGESLSETTFGGVTEFEFKTALGFEYWKRKQCEWVALEVGLGGRLDATNIIEPASTAIVSISLDHVNILGNSLREIAFEKAGIIKEGKPVVVGVVPPDALETIEQVANEKSAPIWRLGREVRWESRGGRVTISTPGYSVTVEPGLFGEVQHHNAAVALAALELGGAIRNIEHVVEGFRTASIPGRFQRVTFEGKQFVLDGAHNQDSAKVLAHLLSEAQIRPKICITGMLTGHVPEDFYSSLKGLVDEFYAVPIDFHRTMDPDDLERVLNAMGLRAKAFKTIEAALSAACSIEETEAVLVCGSFYLVGDVMRLIQSQ